MIISASRKLIQKFFLLGILLSCLGLVSAGVGTKASASGTQDTVRPCCSVCEPDPTIPICRYGCTEGC
jgi:hypothetical protein